MNLHRGLGRASLEVAAPDLDRVIAWTGFSNNPADVQQVDWHSEQGASALTKTSKGVEISVAAQAVERCDRDSTCVLVVQLLKYGPADHATTTMMTEYRHVVVALRQAP